MFYTLAHVAASGYFAASGSPNTISHLTAEKLRVFRFPKPPLNEQVQISDYLDAFIASLRQTEGAIQRAVDLLREYRTALISGAVTGQIDVRTYRKEPEAVLEDM
jgi:type I restriction enzyme S subunit